MQPTHEPLGPGTRRTRFLEAGRPLTFDEVLTGWAEQDAARDAIIDDLVAAPYAAYFWELPGLRAGSLEVPYEHVVVDAPALVGARPAPEVFADEVGEAGVASFDNLGRDARLVVPAHDEGVAAEAYTHLAAFVRAAPRTQAHVVFLEASRTLREELTRGPRWLSTSGLGVPWVHVRIDQRPKYISHAPYRRVR